MFLHSLLMKYYIYVYVCVCASCFSLSSVLVHYIIYTHFSSSSATRLFFTCTIYDFFSIKASVYLCPPVYLSRIYGILVIVLLYYLKNVYSIFYIILFQFISFILLLLN